MTEKELNEVIQVFKEEHLQNIKTLMYKKGELLPMICILVYDNKTDKPAVIVTPVLGNFDELGKETAISELILPKIFDRLRDEDKKPLCFSFSTEAWLRKVDDKENPPADWKSLEKIETVLTTFETKDGSEVVCCTMNRLGKSINEDGELVDRIELTELDMGNSKGHKIQGRFGDIFNKYGF